MSFTDRVRGLLKGKHASINQMLKDIGLGSGTFATWEKRSKLPSGEILLKISDYFGVSTDYLLKGENPPARTAGSLPPDQQKVIEYYERLNGEHQDYIKGEMVRLYMAEQAEREGAASSNEAM